MSALLYELARQTLVGNGIEGIAADRDVVETRDLTGMEGPAEVTRLPLSSVMART